MKNLPITSRVKRSPLLSTDPEEGIKVGGTNKDPDKELNIAERKPYVGVDNDACSTEYIAKNGDAACKKYNELSEEEKNAANMNITKKIIPGETKSWEGELMIGTYGDVFNPDEVRLQSRSIKKEQKDIRRAKIKEAKKKGTLTKEERKRFKAEEATAELKEMNDLAARNKKSRASGRIGGTKNVRTGERGMQQSELESIQEQKKYLEDKADREAAKKNADKNNIVIDSTGTAADIGASAAAADIGASAAAAAVGSIVDPFTGEQVENKKPSPAGMKPSAFKMYGKSPAVKTLQGNQNKLPQQLQDAIKQAPESPAKLGPLAAMAGKAIIGGLVNKALSSNKMKASSFKMKGYGKK